MNESKTKICTKCSVEKSIDKFQIVKERPKSWCKECTKIAYKSYLKKPENKDKYNKARRKYKEKNKEKFKEQRLVADKKRRENLSDGYVAQLLSEKLKIKQLDIRKYPELIETQKLLLKTKRLWKTSQI